MLTLRQLFDDYLAILGFEATADDAPTWARERGLQDIAAALQLMQSAGPDYFGRQTIDVTLVAGQTTYTLAQNIQTVLRASRVGNVPLKKLPSRSHVLQFPAIYLNSATAPSPGSVMAYFPETLRQLSGADSSQVVIHVAPEPGAGAGTLKVDVILEAPTYTDADLCNDATPPVPHQYHESILRPLVRYNATKNHLFRRPDMLPALREDYGRALQMLGLADPDRSPFAEIQPPQPAGAAQ